jgi:hypothetical protein
MDLVNHFLKWLSYTEFWTWINKNFVSKFTFRWDGYPEFPMEKYFDLLKAIEDDEAANGPGFYAFVSCDHKSLSAKMIRFFSKAYWTHAGCLMGTHILHMKAPGALYWHILEEMKQSDYLAVGRVELFPGGLQHVRQKCDDILANLAQFSYDFQMELDNDGKKMYCSELIYHIARDYASDPAFLPKMEFGRLAFEPDDLYKAMRIIFEHKK